MSIFSCPEKSSYSTVLRHDLRYRDSPKIVLRHMEENDRYRGPDLGHNERIPPKAVMNDNNAHFLNSNFINSLYIDRPVWYQNLPNQDF